MTDTTPTPPAKFLEARCLGCREPLDAGRETVRYCGKRCRAVVRTIERANELHTAARAAQAERGWSPEVRAMFEEADAKYAAAMQAGGAIRAELAGRR